MRGAPSAPQNVVAVYYAVAGQSVSFVLEPVVTGAVLKGIPQAILVRTGESPSAATWDGVYLVLSYASSLLPGDVVRLDQFDPAFRTRWGGWIAAFETALPEAAPPPLEFDWSIDAHGYDTVQLVLGSSEDTFYLVDSMTPMLNPGGHLAIDRALFGNWMELTYAIEVQVGMYISTVTAPGMIRSDGALPVRQELAIP